LSVGADHNNSYNGFPGTWPGAINPYGNVDIKRTATCALINVTPQVRFPSITVAELNQGESRQVPITIQMQCQTGEPANWGMTSFVSGVDGNQTAIGILVPPANVKSAASEGLMNWTGSVNYLLSDGYRNDSDVALGVGVAITRPNGAQLNLLGDEQPSIGSLKGWYPVLQDADGSSAGDIAFYTDRYCW
jgi:hypothetical protein